MLAVKDFEFGRRCRNVKGMTGSMRRRVAGWAADVFPFVPVPLARPGRERGGAELFKDAMMNLQDASAALGVDQRSD